MVPLASADAGVTMIWKSRTIGLLLTMAMLTGGAVWGVHALIASAGGAGSDYGLDTNGDRPRRGRRRRPLPRPCLPLPGPCPAPLRGAAGARAVSIRRRD